MTAIPKLTDLQLVLLSAAGGRDDGMLLPPPGTVRARGKTLESTLTKLLRHGLVEETAAAAPEQAWREAEDGSPVALRISAAGREALGLPAGIGVASDDPAPEAPDGEAARSEAREGGPPPAKATPPTKPGTKQHRLAAYLARPSGIDIEELSQLLGWQRHTVRAALTSLRKKGYAVTHRKGEQGVTLYSATPPAEAVDDAA